MDATKNVDDLLFRTGGFGCYQKLLIAANVIFFFGYNWQVILTNFIAAEPNHWCQLPQLKGRNESLLKDIFIPKTTDELGREVFDQCNMLEGIIMEDISYVNDSAVDIMYPLDVVMNFSVQSAKVPCKYGWSYDQSEFTSTIVTQYQLVCDKEWLMTLPAMAFIVGILTGAFITGYISDRFGRQRTASILTLLQILATLCAAFTVHFWMFLTLRYLVGFAWIGSYAVFWILIIEQMPPVHRSHCTFYVTVGRITRCALPLTAYFIRNHVHLQIVSAIVAIPGLICLMLLPESPRWLLAQKQFNKFEKVIKKIAKINKIEFMPEYTDTLLTSDSNTSEIQEKKLKIAFTDFFRTPRIRRHTLIIIFIWISGVFTQYAMMLNAGTLIPGNIYLQTALVLGASELASFLPMWLVAFKLGRRKSFIICFITNGACSLLIIPLLLVDIPILVSITGMIGMSIALVIHHLLYLYTGEIFPTPARNTGLGGVSAISRFASLLTPQIPLLKHVWFGLPYICLSILPLLAGSFAYALPETKDKHLPETLEEAENFGITLPKTDENLTKLDDIETDDVANI